MVKKVKKTKTYSEKGITKEDFKAIQNNLSGLEKLIQNHIGNVNLELFAELKNSERYQQNQIYIKSANLVETFPVLKTMFKTNIIYFSSLFDKDEDGNIMFDPICKYTQLNGGGNGCKFIWKSLKFGDGKWTEDMF